MANTTNNSFEIGQAVRMELQKERTKQRDTETKKEDIGGAYRKTTKKEKRKTAKKQKD